MESGVRGETSHQWARSCRAQPRSLPALAFQSDCARCHATLPSTAAETASNRAETGWRTNQPAASVKTASDFNPWAARVWEQVWVSGLISIYSPIGPMDPVGQTVHPQVLGWDLWRAFNTLLWLTEGAGVHQVDCLTDIYSLLLWNATSLHLQHFLYVIFYLFLLTGQWCSDFLALTNHWSHRNLK